MLYAAAKAPLALLHAMLTRRATHEAVLVNASFDFFLILHASSIAQGVGHL